MRMVILYDNKQYAKGWESGWGFSALVENNNNQKILFDTGDNSAKLLCNINNSHIDPQSINALTFSHADWDHKDGAEGFLKVNKKAFVYIPHSFPGEFKDMVEKTGHNYALNGYQKSELVKDVFSTPLYSKAGSSKELALVIKINGSLVLVTGCAHPGILKMVRKVKDIFSMNVEMIAGGFHLKSFPEDRVKSLIGNLKKHGVERFAPCHCTGDRQIAVFKKMCRKGFTGVGSGKEILF